MEIFLAIVLLSLSTLAGFSTDENRPKPKTKVRPSEDPDWRFMQTCDLNSSITASIQED